VFYKFFPKLTFLLTIVTFCDVRGNFNIGMHLLDPKKHRNALLQQ